MLKVIVFDSLSDDLPKFVDTTRNEFDYRVLYVTYVVCISISGGVSMGVCYQQGYPSNFFWINSL